MSSWVLFIELIWSYLSSKRTYFAFVRWQAIVAWEGSVLDVSVSLLKSLCCDPILWLFWKSYYLVNFFFINNGPLKVQVSSFSSFCIKNYLAPFFCPHSRQFSLSYGIGESLGIWYDLGWYCWLVFWGCVDTDLVHSDVEMYCQNIGWKGFNHLMGCCRVYICFL